MVNGTFLLPIEWEKFAECRVKERLLPGPAALGDLSNSLENLRFADWHSSR
jgi:hypothetical protein